MPDQQETDPIYGPGYVVVPGGVDAERMADVLIADSLPRLFLQEIDLSGPDGPQRFVRYLLYRREHASIEKDELVAFVRRNQRALLRTNLLETLAPQFPYIVKNLHRVLADQVDQVDLVSSRLLWLCVALDFHVGQGSLSHDAAVEILHKPEHRQRIAPQAVLYMCNDYLSNRDTLDSPRSEYIMLLTECALLCGDRISLVFAFVLLSDTPPPADVHGWLGLVERAATRLQAMGGMVPEYERLLQRARARYADDVTDDDF